MDSAFPTSPDLSFVREAGPRSSTTYPETTLGYSLAGEELKLCPKRRKEATPACNRSCPHNHVSVSILITNRSMV
jgi:hypothetical protein